MKSTKTATKEISILHIYRWKSPISRICFEIESTSDSSIHYNVCFSNDSQHGTCGCEGFEKWHKECRHLKALRPQAAQFFESRQPAEAEAEAEEDECPGLVEAEAHIASLKEQFQVRQLAAAQPVRQEDWKESAQFGSQVHKMEAAGKGGRLVPMR